MKLSHLTILLGVVMALPQVYGLLNPAGLAAAARKLPRSLPAGVVLMLIATAWFAWNVNVEPIADFSAFKPYMLGAFIAVGVFSCIFVRDFLAVRGLAVLMLLLAKLMTDTGRPYLPATIFHAQTGESSWVLVIQGWAYLFAVVGIWFTVTPWRLRDIINWATDSAARVRILCFIRLAFAAFIVGLGLTVLRGM